MNKEGLCNFCLFHLRKADSNNAHNAALYFANANYAVLHFANARQQNAA